MSQHRQSGRAGVADDDRSLRDLIDRNRLAGLATVLIGISQVLLGMAGLGNGSWSGLTVSSWSIFLLMGGGGLLVGIGGNLLQGREAFESGWNSGFESEQLSWLSAAVTLLFAIAMAAGAIWVLLT